jgi:hypothetical protein
VSKVVYIDDCTLSPQWHCGKIKFNRYLTFGKVYDKVESYIDGYVCVINDLGEEEIYDYYVFMDLDTWRELRIKEVLGEV